MVDLIDVTLACEDANSKLVNAISLADVDAEKRIDDRLTESWKLKFGQDIRLELGQDY